MQKIGCYLVPFVLLVLPECGGLVSHEHREQPVEAGVIPGDPCAPPRTPDDTRSVYVDGARGLESAACGSRAQPCKTIQTGISAARGSGRPLVLVAAGSYVETVKLPAGVSVEGAWRADGSTWQALCGADARSAVQIQAPADSEVTVQAQDIGGAAELHSVTILSRTAAPIQGGSLYGIRAVGQSTQLSLTDVAVAVAKAGDGFGGPPGANGSSGSMGGCGMPGNGSSGQQTGVDGAPAPLGSFDRFGYTSANGSSGSDGAPGQNGGPPSSPPACFTNCGACQYPDQAACLTTPDSCGTEGKAGCAGGAGTGGGGGGGGGSSIALFVWQASVSVSNSDLRAGLPGSGGIGGPAGSAGLGSDGVPGQTPQAASCTRCSVTYMGAYAGSAIIVCDNAPVGIGAAGGKGGKGGDGTSGGSGAHGRDGASCAIYQSSSGLVSVTGSSSLEFAQPADAGADTRGLAGTVCP